MSKEVQVLTKKKKRAKFAGLTIVQEMEECHEGDIMVAKFSKDGKYLATGGSDGFCCVWEVDSKITSLEEPLVNPEPMRQYLNGDHGEVVALDWSEGNFLVASTNDQQVFVWDVRKNKQIANFEHEFLCPAVAFHPTDDFTFCTGSLDENVRLYDVKAQKVICMDNAKKMVTSVTFKKDGEEIMAGTTNGKCVFFEITGEGEERKMRTKHIIEVRSRRGKNKEGKKITGIVLAPKTAEVMISTNDSRIRCYSLINYQETTKYAGHVNQTGRMYASYSLDGTNVISCSENRQVIIWDVVPAYMKKKRAIAKSFEFFSEPAPILNAIFTPFNMEDQEIILTTNSGGGMRIYLNRKKEL